MLLIGTGTNRRLVELIDLVLVVHTRLVFWEQFQKARTAVDIIPG
jgi:hypothetical protein